MVLTATDGSSTGYSAFAQDLYDDAKLGQNVSLQNSATGSVYQTEDSCASAPLYYAAQGVEPAPSYASYVERHKEIAKAYFPEWNPNGFNVPVQSGVNLLSLCPTTSSKSSSRSYSFFSPTSYNLNINSNNNNDRRNSNDNKSMGVACCLCVLSVAIPALMGVAAKLGIWGSRLSEAKESDIQLRHDRSEFAEATKRINAKIITGCEAQRRLGYAGGIAAITGIAACALGSVGLAWAAGIGGIITVAIAINGWTSGKLNITKAISREFHNNMDTLKSHLNSQADQVRIWNNWAQ